MFVDEVKGMNEWNEIVFIQSGKVGTRKPLLQLKFESEGCNR